MFPFVPPSRILLAAWCMASYIRQKWPTSVEVGALGAGGEAMRFLSGLAATRFRSENYSVVFDRQVQEWFKRQHADLLREMQDWMRRWYELADDAETARAALADVSQYLIGECVTTALCRRGWELAQTAALGYCYEKRLGLGFLYVNFRVSGLLEHNPNFMGGGITVYERERIDLQMCWLTSLTARVAAPGHVVNDIIDTVVREIEGELHGAGWRYDPK